MRITQYLSFRVSCTWYFKLCCRSRIPLESRRQRLDAVVDKVQSPSGNLAGGYRSLRSGMESPAAQVRKLDSTAERNSSKRVLPQLVKSKSVCFSPIRVNSEMPSKDQERESESHFSLPVVAVPAVVATIVGDGNRSASSLSLPSSSFTLERVEPAPAASVGQISFIRLDVIRRRLQERGLSAEVIELLLASSRSSTAAAYQSAWNKWCCWNVARGFDPLSNTLNNILQYLNDLFRSGLAAQTINSHRSMLSMTLDPIDGHNIGEHPLIVQLLKGCYNSKPPRARYNIMWDPDVVLKHFVSLPENKVLSLTIISQKLATLIALACLLRVSEIAAISVSSINFSESTTTFSISRPRKTQHLGPLRSFSLPRLSGPTCPVDCLQNYVERTASLRQQHCDRLFISLKRPHKSIDSSTIARWIKQCLTSAGVNNDFGAHSTRGSAASKAARAGISTNQILKAASWTSELVFDRFYHRDTSNSNTIAQTVLTQSSSHL